MSLKLVTGPTVEPMDVETAKDYFRATDYNDEDILIEEIITASRRKIEQETGKAMLSQVWYYYLDCWPRTNRHGIVEIKLPLAPVISFDQVQVWKYGENDYSNLDSSLYVTDKEGRTPRVVQLENATLPELSVRPNAIRIRFTAGFGTQKASVPKELMIAMKMLARHYWDNKKVFSEQGSGAVEIPRTIDYLIEDFRDNLF